jgi:hypothetical protein
MFFVVFQEGSKLLLVFPLQKSSADDRQVLSNEEIGGRS